NPGSPGGKFAQRYRKQPRIFSAPGRVNLIGEHTDYNDGFVLPMAIDRRTYVACSPRPDRKVQVHSTNLDETAVFDLNDLPGQSTPAWLAYVWGVAATLLRQGIVLKGADVLIESQVPIGGGLSSSAALEVAFGRALLSISETSLGPAELALAAQQAEHDFAGTRCGIMDQLTVTLAQAQHALLIDCRSLEAKQIPLTKLAGAFVVCNTKVKHELASSAYNQRRHECETAVEILSKLIGPVDALREVNLKEFLRVANELPEPLGRRCRHVITENTRTLDAARALATGDAAALGKLMKASHES